MRQGRARAGLRASLLLVMMAAGCAQRTPADAPREPTLVEVLRIPGDEAGGELGFRFGPPGDVDGDGVDDVAAGARLADLDSTQVGCAGVWSSESGRRIARWDGDTRDALFGNAVLIGPDGDGDGLPDVVASAPHGSKEGGGRGTISLISPRSGRQLWRRVGEPDESFGWHLARAGDQDGDGVSDVFAGAPRTSAPGRVLLLGGRDGTTLRVYTSRERSDLFGWHVAAVSDLDGDGRRDLLVGAPSARGAAGLAGAAYAISAADGRVLHAWSGAHPYGEFGQVVAAAGDLDGDGLDEVIVAEPRRAAPGDETLLAGEVSVFSGKSGERLFHWVSPTPGELYGRIVAGAGDVDGDGTPDVVIGAPWSSAHGLEKSGRIELRSGKSGAVLAEATGDRQEAWLGWHIEVGERLGRERRRGLVVSALRSDEGGRPAVGSLVIYLFSQARRN